MKTRTTTTNLNIHVESISSYGKNFRSKNAIRWLLTALFSVGSYPAWSNGFFLPDQNATNLGTAYAGTASLAEDASTNFYNAAGLTRLSNEQIVAGGALSAPHTKLYVTNATSTFGTNIGAGFTRGKDLTFAPWLHYANRIDDCWIFGASISPTYGSRLDFNSGSIARYTATTSKLVTADFGPSLAYQFNDMLSLGLGVDAVYAHANVSNQIGSGNISTDGYRNDNASRWGYGYHAGLMLEPSSCTRFGVSYRSRVKLKLKGEDLQVISGTPAPTVIIKQGVRADITLPDTATLSAYHAFNDCWAVMADAQWLHWNLFEHLKLRYENGTIATINQNWRDSYRVALGGTYQFTQEIRLRMGASYDKTPTKDETRCIFIPDENQIGVGFGAQYRFDKCLAFDFGYVHVFSDRATVNQNAPTISGTPLPFALQQSLVGSVKRRMDILGLQVTWDLM